MSFKQNERINTLGKGAGWLGILTAAASLIAYEVNPAWRIYVNVALILSLALLVFFFTVHFEALKSFSARRSTKLGLNSVLMVLIFLAILGILNFISSRHHARFDFSETEAFTLAPQTLQVLKNLGRDVRILAFVSDQSRSRASIKDLLSNYGYHSARISYSLIDPDKKPSVTKQYGITQYDTLVLESEKQATQVKTVNEQEVTNAIIRISKDQQRKIRFLEDHGEHSLADTEKGGYSLARDGLLKQGFEIGSLSLLEEGKVPDDTAVLVIAGPQKGFLPQEKAALLDYLSRNGKVLLLLDPNETTNLDDLLSRWGIKMGRGLIIDTRSRLLGGDFTIPVVIQYPSHEVTQNFNLATFFPVSQAVNFDPSRASEFEFKPLAQTSEDSWSKTHFRSGQMNFNPAEDVRGPLTLAAVVTWKPRSAEPHDHDTPPGSETPEADKREAEKNIEQAVLVVFGDSDFAANAPFNFSGNGDLFLNTVSWLAQEKNLISIRPKEPRFTPLFLSRSQGKLLMVVSLLLLPSAVVVTGLLIWRRRRHL